MSQGHLPGQLRLLVFQEKPAVWVCVKRLCFSNSVCAQAHTSRPPVFTSALRILYGRAKEEPMFQLSPVPVTASAVISKRLRIFHKLSAMLSSRFLITFNIYEIKKSQTLLILPEEKCSLMSPLKRKNYFCKRNNSCSHLLSLFVQHSKCFNNKSRTRPPIAPRGELPSG